MYNNSDVELQKGLIAIEKQADNGHKLYMPTPLEFDLNLHSMVMNIPDLCSRVCRVCAELQNLNPQLSQIGKPEAFCASCRSALAASGHPAFECGRKKIGKDGAEYNCPNVVFIGPFKRAKCCLDCHRKLNNRR